MTGTLYLVAVPIGNLDDMSTRARVTLESVAVVAAEDTRHFATLARHHSIGTRAVSYHDHNEEARTRELVGRLEAGDLAVHLAEAKAASACCNFILKSLSSRMARVSPAFTSWLSVNLISFT